MKICNFLLFFVIAILPFSVFAGSLLTEQRVEYRVKFMGQPSAMRVCKAIIHDDPQKLDRILQHDLRNMPHRNRYTVLSPKIAGSYTCNDLALLPFADEIGAMKVSSYLQGSDGRVTIEEMVSTRD